MTVVIPIDARDLPRVSAEAAAGLSRAARALASLPADVEVSVGDLGGVRIACSGVRSLLRSRSDETEATTDVALGLTRASGPGRLVIDGALAQRVVAASVGTGARPESPLLRLGLAERGVVAGVAAAVVACLRGPFSVSLVAPSAAAVVDAGGVGVELSIDAVDFAGWARLEIPASWFPIPPIARAELDGLEVEARIQLASTRLAVRELAGVEPGDAIVFDGEPAFSATRDEREVRISVGPLAARGALRQDGTVLLLEVLRMREEANLETRDEPGEQSIERGASNQAVDVAAVLADMPIEIVAELGRVSLRGDEVAALAPGAIVRLGRAGMAPVGLRVGDQLWAEGELVSIDGELGVRVTATRGRGLP